jgi:O-antigen ligase
MPSPDGSPDSGVQGTAAALRPIATRLAGVLTVAGIVAIALGWPWGLALLLPGWVLLALFDGRALVIALIAGVPLTTFGWHVELAQIAGRHLDVRLALTFAVAGISLGAIIRAPKRSPSVPEWLFAGFIGWSIVSGVLASDSYLTWGPPVARAIAYGSVFALGRRYLTGARDLEVAMAAMVAGFLLPTLAGIAQFALGQAQFVNEAARATAPGGRGPISLAFEGEVVLLLSFSLLALSSTIGWRLVWLLAAAAGTTAVLASATRLVTVTAWGAIVAFAAFRRSWRTVIAVTVILGAAFFVRPDLMGRFLGTVVAPVVPSGQAAPSAEPSDAVEVDASLRFRFFVWSAILEEWTRHPLTGIGPGMTARVVAERSPAERAAPHNDYLGVFAELSVLGFLAYVAIQVAVLTGIYRRMRQAPKRRAALLASVGLLFIGLNVVGALNNPIYFFDIQIGLWALVGAGQLVRVGTMQAAA